MFIRAVIVEAAPASAAALMTVLFIMFTRCKTFKGLSWPFELIGPHS